MHFALLYSKLGTPCTTETPSVTGILGGVREIMRCFVYKSRKKAETYLYIPHKGEFSVIPDVLMKVFGVPEFALEFELTPDRKLAVADARDVIDFLDRQGFYLQMPAENEYPI